MLAARDVRSSLGKNLSLAREMTGLDPGAAGPGQLQAALNLSDRRKVPERDQYCVPLQAHYVADIKEEEESLKTLIDSLVLN